MYQTIIIDELSSPNGRVDWWEVIQAMPADGRSRIEFADMSPDANPVSEFASGRIH